MDSKQTNTAPANNVIITKRGVKMDFEGKIPFKQRMIMRLTSSSFWIDRVWYLFRFILMVGISFDRSRLVPLPLHSDGGYQLRHPLPVP